MLIKLLLNVLETSLIVKPGACHSVDVTPLLTMLTVSSLGRLYHPGIWAWAGESCWLLFSCLGRGILI